MDGSVVPSAAERQRMEEYVAKAQEGLADVAPYLVARGIKKETAESFRLGLGHGPLAGRLIIPTLTPAGVSAVKGRCVSCEKCVGHGKYQYLPGRPHALYNVAALLDNDGVVAVCEGELDAQVVTQEVMPCLAYPGVSSWRPFFSRAFAGQDEVIVVADGDEVGRAAAKAVSAEIGRFADRVRVVRMPDGEDSNSYFLAHGADRLKELLSE